MSAAGAPVVAHGDQQGRGSPSEWFMGKLAGHSVAHSPSLAAAVTPRIVIGDPARQHHAIGSQALSGHLAEAVSDTVLVSASRVSMPCLPVVAM